MGSGFSWERSQLQQPRKGARDAKNTEPLNPACTVPQQGRGLLTAEGTEDAFQDFPSRVSMQATKNLRKLGASGGGFFEMSEGADPSSDPLGAAEAFATVHALVAGTVAYRDVSAVGTGWSIMLVHKRATKDGCPTGSDRLRRVQGGSDGEHRVHGNRFGFF